MPKIFQLNSEKRKLSTKKPRASCKRGSSLKKKINKPYIPRIMQMVRDIKALKEEKMVNQ
jgi:hypothetical protein